MIHKHIGVITIFSKKSKATQEPIILPHVPFDSTLFFSTDITTIRAFSITDQSCQLLKFYRQNYSNYVWFIYSAIYLGVSIVFYVKSQITNFYIYIIYNMNLRTFIFLFQSSQTFATGNCIFKFCILYRDFYIYYQHINLYKGISL